MWIRQIHLDSCWFYRGLWSLFIFNLCDLLENVIWHVRTPMIWTFTLVAMIYPDSSTSIHLIWGGGVVCLGRGEKDEIGSLNSGINEQRSWSSFNIKTNYRDQLSPTGFIIYTTVYDQSRRTPMEDGFFCIFYLSQKKKKNFYNEVSSEIVCSFINYLMAH